MRISANPDDPGYINYLAYRNVRVFLDGIERSGVVTADEEKRMIVMHKRDERGNFVLDGDKPVGDVWTGTVHIEGELLASGGLVQSSSDRIPLQFSAPAVNARIIQTVQVYPSDTKVGRDIAAAIQRAIRRNA